MDAYNDQDMDAVMAFYSEDSVVINAPAANVSVQRTGTVLEGLSDIRSMTLTSFALAAESNAYEFSNFDVVENTVTWDAHWTNYVGQTYCSTGRDQAIVEDGIIVSWTFANSVPCTQE